MASASGQRHHGASPNGNRSLSHLASALGAAALVSGVSLGVPGAGQAAGGVTVTSFGHSALLIRGGGATVLVNPFKAVGCAAGLAEPRVRADVILASSRLLDEGAPRGLRPDAGHPRLLPGGGPEAGGGSHPPRPHRRTALRPGHPLALEAGGLEIAHLGGTASALRPEDRVLIGKPDVLIIGVGGGAKVYDGAEAAAVVRELEPRRVIPVQYVSGSAPSGCDQGNIEPFLEAMSGTPVQRVGRTVSFGSPLNDGPLIKVMR
ncbi:MBL fold metallo-hydrolase [Cyanobium sp. BSA11S]|uniref:MBL fold metallo-hydrolase n=1 Tax=Cyanobium sp. BSA11S TaxID=3108224 RepID=UPI003D814AC3